MKNTGRKSEDIFDEAWKRLGKVAHVFTFTDASKATGLNGRKTLIAAQPSDRLVTYQGKTFYAEIKSTWDETCFQFSLLRPTQGAYAAAIIAAGGVYDVFIHALATDLWYRVPYPVIKAAPQKHLKWQELSKYLWSFPTS